MDENFLLGACGLYCGACYHYRASFPEGAHLLKDAELQGKNLAGFTCQGCRSGQLYLHAGCSQCKIRVCTDNKGISHCGLCSDCPCQLLLEFQNDGRLHHLFVTENLKDITVKGGGQWLSEQEKRWQCQCGSGFSWYETTCQNCGSPLNSYRK